MARKVVQFENLVEGCSHVFGIGPFMTCLCCIYFVVFF